MMKSLYSEILWSKIKTIGFDIDGTLYDESEFISQVYQPIACELSKVAPETNEEIYASMMSKWKEMGSGFNRIFEDVLIDLSLTTKHRDKIIQNCLEIFHNFKPVIHLSPFIEEILSEAQKDFNLFIVTDGHVRLQKSKFDSLGLSRWFRQENVGFCGGHDTSFAKPSPQILQTLEVFGSGNSMSKVVFFGDREVDMLFASNSGFQFVQVKCMVPIVDSIKYE